MNFKDFVKEIGLPLVSRSGRIIYMNDRTDPIRIELRDGTSLAMTLEQFRKIEGDRPEVGKNLHVQFLGNVGILGDPVKVVSARCG